MGQVQSVARESVFKSYADMPSWVVLIEEERANSPGNALRDPMTAMAPYEKEFIRLEEQNEKRIMNARQRGDHRHEKNLTHLKMIRNQIRRKTGATQLEMEVFYKLEGETEARESELSGEGDVVMG